MEIRKMTYFIKHGNTFHISNTSAIDITDRLPPGTYVCKYNDQTKEYSLDTVDAFSLPDELFGSIKTDAERIMKTYKQRNASMGVLLSGQKGAGKTLLTKYVANEFTKINIPTIIVNDSHKSDTFLQFLQSIDHECLVIFDEFEKIFDDKSQQQILTLLDGVFSTNKLYMFTCNNKFLLNENMLNRPGRIYYRLDYNKLTSETITDVCAAKLKSKSSKSVGDICALAGSMREFSYDMLDAIINEMNSYNESLVDVLKFLNIRIEDSGTGSYDCKITNSHGATIKSDVTTVSDFNSFRYYFGYSAKDLAKRPDMTLNKTPISAKTKSEAPVPGNAKSIEVELFGDEDDEDWHSHTFTLADIDKMDGLAGEYVFKRNELTLVLKARKPSKGLIDFLG